MVHLAKKKKNDKTYLYLEERGWINGKSKRLWQIYLGPEHEFKDRSRIISIPQVETETIEFGLIAALLSVARKLNLVKIINDFTTKRNQELSVGDHMLLAAINRCMEPVSKNQLKAWFESTVLKKIYPVCGSALDSRSYWNHYRYLTDENIELIGNEIARAVIRKFNVSFNDLLFDPTNFFTFINPKKSNQQYPRHGHSKEGRDTLNLVNFSLFCALDGGIPFLHLIYPGNNHDSKHFKIALKKLKQRLSSLNLDSSEITLTFDKGNLSKEAFNFIDSEKLNYICSIRPTTQKDLLSISPKDFKMTALPNGKKIGIMEFMRRIYGKERRIIAVYNPKQARWQRENYEFKLKKKITDLEKFFQNRLNSKRWSNREKIIEKCRTVLGSKKFLNAVNIEISEKEGALSLSINVNEEGFKTHCLTLGKSFLMTNRTDLTASEVVWAYRQQYIIERAFKTLKNPRYLSIRPMYVSVDSSIRGHCFTCFLGLLLLSLLVRELIAQGIPMSIPKAINTLKKIKITKITIPGRKKPLYKLNKMDDTSKLVYDALNLRQFV